MAVRTFAAIDVGSFELEMGIFEFSAKNGMREVDHLRHVIPLGKDTYTNGKISYGLIDEMCKVLNRFSVIMKEYQVEDYTAYATSALREANNNQIVIDQVKVRTGLKVSIISNSEQRFLCYKALASKDMDFTRIIQKGTAIVDVGFGSIQVSLFDKDTLVSTQNMMLGALRINGMLSRLSKDLPSINCLVEELVDNDLYTFKKLYLKDRDIKNLIGIGDCILYLSRKFSADRQSDRISTADFMGIYTQIIQMSIDQIEQTYNVSTEFASLLVPTVMIYKRMLEITGAEMVWIPGIKFSDGIAAGYGDDCKLLKLNHDFTADILVASRNISKRYLGHKGHTLALEKNVVKIFDSMKKYHGLGSRQRLLLQISAILHDCGKYISMKNPGECAFNIIMSTEIIGLSHLEREIVANTVKYNTMEFHYSNILESNVDAISYILVAKLTAILRIANAMDRSHKQKFDNSKLSVKNQELVITTDYVNDITLERVMFEQKADFFEEIYGIRPILKQKRGI